MFFLPVFSPMFLPFPFSQRKQSVLNMPFPIGLNYRWKRRITLMRHGDFLVSFCLFCFQKLTPIRVLYYVVPDVLRRKTRKDECKGAFTIGKMVEAYGFPEKRKASFHSHSGSSGSHRYSEGKETALWPTKGPQRRLDWGPRTLSSDKCTHCFPNMSEPLPFMEELGQSVVTTLVEGIASLPAQYYSKHKL